MSDVVSAGDFTSLWCDIILEELYRNGVQHICLAPGSRSAPFALALSRHQQLTTHTHYDERGLGFYALGLARATGAPVVIITTSGTAVANLYPALLEAKESAIPLMVLSADRPPELLGCAANQTLEQPGIYASCPAFSVNLPCPEPSLPARWLLSVIDEAVAVMNRPDAGPVHINQALRDPLYGSDTPADWSSWLEPVAEWRGSHNPLCLWDRSAGTCPSLPDISGPVVLVVGQLSQQESRAVAELADNIGWLLLADIQSGLQGHARALSCVDLTLANPEILARLNQTELVIQCGRRPISKRLGQWLGKGGREHWYIDSRQDRHDPVFSVTRRVSCSIKDFCQATAGKVSLSPENRAWSDNLLLQSRTLVETIKAEKLPDNQLTEIWAAEQLKQSLTTEALFIGNSMPVRYLDSLSSSWTDARIIANRGASGIDGLIASAAGHAASGQRTVLLIGDLSFLHDLNSLNLAAQHGLVIVLLNNSGGTIFNMFPVSRDDNTLSRYFRIEHSLQGVGAATMFGLNYRAPETCEDFQASLSEALASPEGALIEVCTPPDQGTDQFKSLVHAARDYSVC
ncbi:2-succinyl-5-enolpyruvyl-6-hydroxy-3-cyclohexene-1-carboxylic-acid synthase [Sansalvadorimonas sp. 2012CJ34-2]|uniref:2-succinyl-5-enolpyruvyl-6-hydroxy-3-cyclohexene-1-carboxylate synthase n=1 Tax=Parendozoicomonas callyspongiae TaxID=2942213 RepID=A0ABT0PDJ4_9GAMM|nr:2-succinyl-5-enolpyruvyl-6-hydroxy-3-cyclohexene-1-carboxylic-acid synthase [Sansalvadorimonas sp. 2012CJ34-2]MCL6269442.1 2-succinyl-5-enolpyruvyl-6-hydroxy-3-cyclohexene-1-carboxylic-acid synthase [Sansalvadorimonas sp. 2012CJ34-2]